MQTRWEELNLLGWNEERQRWCRVTDVDVDDNRVGLSTGVVRFWQPLSSTDFLCKEFLDEST